MFVLYNRIILSVIGAFATAVVVLSILQEPLDGDLARVGGYSERDFGSNEEQESFTKDYLFKWAHNLSALDHHYDVVVVGDSFSTREHYSWLSYLADATGWDILLFHYKDVGFRQLVGSKQFAAHPPTLVVLESVERHIIRRLADLRVLPNPGELEASRTPNHGSRRTPCNERASEAPHAIRGPQRTSVGRCART